MEQKFLNDRSGRALGLAAVAMLAAGIMSLEGYDARLISYAAAIGMGLLFAGAYMQFRGKGEALVDERTKRVSRAALSYSWWFSYVVIAILMVLAEFQVAEMSTSAVLGILFFFMVASQYLFRWHLNRKGDVE